MNDDTLEGTETTASGSLPPTSIENVEFVDTDSKSKGNKLGQVAAVGAAVLAPHMPFNTLPNVDTSALNALNSQDRSVQLENNPANTDLSSMIMAPTPIIESDSAADQVSVNSKASSPESSAELSESLKIKPEAIELVSSTGEVVVIADVNSYLNGIDAKIGTSIVDSINRFSDYLTENGKSEPASFRISLQSTVVEEGNENTPPTLTPELTATPTPDGSIQNSLVYPYFSLPGEGYLDGGAGGPGGPEFYHEDNADLIKAFGVDLEHMDQMTSDFVSNWYIKPNGKALEVNFVYPETPGKQTEKPYSHLGSIANGTPDPETGKIIWRAKDGIEVASNVSLRELSLTADGATGKEAVAGLVRENDIVEVPGLGIIFELENVLSKDGTNPYDNVDFKFTDDFKNRLIKYANTYMKDLAGYTIKLRILDENDPAMQSYLRTTSIDNQDTIWGDTYAPDLSHTCVYGFGGSKDDETKRIYYNLFINRKISDDPGALGVGGAVTTSIQSSIMYINYGIFSRDVNAYDRIPDITNKYIALGSDPISPYNTVPIVTWNS